MTATPGSCCGQEEPRRGPRPASSSSRRNLLDALQWAEAAAEQEGEFSSLSIKAALAEAKARGGKLAGLAEASMTRKDVLKVKGNERAGNPRLKPCRPRSVARLRCHLKAAERSPYIAWFIAAAHGLGALCMVEKGTSPMGDQDSPSAFASIRALRDDLRARLDQNEDFRAWRALDQALRELDPPTLPKAVEMVLTGTGTRPDDNVAFSFGRRS